MASNEFYKSVKNTEQAAKATAAATAFSIGSNLAMQGRLIASQNQAIAEAQRAADYAEATYDTQLQALDEQRAHNYAMWRQTPNGAAYEEWKGRAWLLITAIQARDASFYEPFETDVVEYTAAEKSRLTAGGSHTEVPKSTPWRVVSGILALIGAAAVVVGGLLLALALFLWLISFGRQGSDNTWPLIIAGSGLVLVLMWVFTPQTPESKAWSETEKKLTAADTAARIAHFGFDPTSEPSRKPAHWTVETNAVPWLQQFMSKAYTSHPAAHELVALTMPAVRDPQTETHLLTQARLEAFVAEDRGAQAGPN